MTTSSFAFAFSPSGDRVRSAPAVARVAMQSGEASSSVTSAGAAKPGDDRMAELRLVRDAGKGDDAAFAALYATHAPRVYALLLRLSGSRVDAGELLQDTFVQAWRGLREWRADSSLATWLHRIAVNAHLGRVRAQRRRAVHELATDELEAFAGIATPARDAGDAVDLERAIAALPPAMRTAFVLHDVEGCPYDEISRTTGTAEGTLRAQVSRARLLLGRALGR